MVFWSMIEVARGDDGMIPIDLFLVGEGRDIFRVSIDPFLKNRIGNHFLVGRTRGIISRRVRPDGHNSKD